MASNLLTMRVQKPAGPTEPGNRQPRPTMARGGVGLSTELSTEEEPRPVPVRRGHGRHSISIARRARDVFPGNRTGEQESLAADGRFGRLKRLVGVADEGEGDQGR